MEAAKPAGRRQRTKDTAAFRTEVVRRVNQDGQAATRVAQALGISEAVLGKWGRAARAQGARPAGSEALEQDVVGTRFTVPYDCNGLLPDPARPGVLAGAKHHYRPEVLK